MWSPRRAAYTMEACTGCAEACQTGSDIGSGVSAPQELGGWHLFDADAHDESAALLRAIAARHLQHSRSPLSFGPMMIVMKIKSRFLSGCLLFLIAPPLPTYSLSHVTLYVSP